ncbi:hypothetical protein GGR57DRAFT_498847 [Xylariaceae sp. FL1272]|nr:hypothetical protein GGR57DRAFT_498847 [Xylariaceae sp. FL1272]
MAPAADPAEHFKFLISCIRHSQNGKVDFEEVRKELGINTKGAAAKRYERLMKQHGITKGGAGVKSEPSTPEGKAAKAPKTPKTPKSAKKRKLEEVDEEEGDTDEPIKTEAAIKGEVKSEDAITVKSEHSNGLLGLPSTDQYTSYPSSPPRSLSTNPDASDENDEVFFVSAHEKQNTPISSEHDHHLNISHSRSHAASAHGLPAFDYATNMTLPQQLPATPARPDVFPYGFAPGPWMYPHDAHGYH